MGKGIPRKTQKLAFQEADSKCSFCGESDINVLEIHHIVERARKGTNDLNNLVVACANCHERIRNGAIPLEEVVAVKFSIMQEHNRSQSRPPQEDRAGSSVFLNKSVNTGVIANTINIRTPRKSSIKIGPPDGTIAADRDQRNYVKHLIDRYHEFKKAEVGAEMKYVILYRKINKEFKAKWDMIPADRFPELVQFLQDRIDGTILGRNRKKKGQKNYSTFDEYVEGSRPRSR